MKGTVLSITELNRYVTRLIEEDYLLNDLWIKGEVSNCKYHHSGHIYFTIKDQLASIQAVMFARDASRLTLRLEEGKKICAHVRIALYEKTGTYQAYVFEVQMEGTGSLYEQFEALKAKLREQGLFEAYYKKPIPKIPKSVGVITAETGAALQDILQIAKRRNGSIPIYIYPTHVQGAYAKDEIVKAIRKANKDRLVDVLIVGRGGGSIEDLWAFNEECVANAIFESQLPIVSAVGHEVDFTISDFVSDLRAPTPSAAAELVFPSKIQYQELIEGYEKKLKALLQHKIFNHQERLNYLLERPVFKRKDMYFKNKLLEVDEAMHALNKAYQQRVERSHYAYNLKINQLEKLSPLNTLKRGYSVVVDESGNTINHLEAVKVDDVIKVTLQDGNFWAKVLKKGK